MAKFVTTGMCDFHEDKNELLSGNERWPVVGRKVDEETVGTILRSFAGLGKYWDCLEKAKKSQKILGGRVVIGELMVVSGDHKSGYGYYWRPPFEFHAWVELEGGGIFDGALPGVIEKGLRTSDTVGPYLVDREPVILAGEPRDWMKYQPKESLDQAMVASMKEIASTILTFNS